MRWISKILVSLAMGFGFTCLGACVRIMLILFLGRWDASHSQMIGGAFLAGGLCLMFAWASFFFIDIDKPKQLSRCPFCGEPCECRRPVPTPAPPPAARQVLMPTPPPTEEGR